MILVRSTQRGESFGKNLERWDVIRAAGVAVEAQVCTVLFLCCSFMMYSYESTTRWGFLGSYIIEDLLVLARLVFIVRVLF